MFVPLAVITQALSKQVLFAQVVSEFLDLRQLINLLELHFD